MTDRPPPGLWEQLLAERFGPVQSPTPPMEGSTVEVLRQIELCADDGMAEVIPLPDRKRRAVPHPTQGRTASA